MLAINCPYNLTGLASLNFFAAGIKKLVHKFVFKIHAFTVLETKRESKRTLSSHP